MCDQCVQAGKLETSSETLRALSHTATDPIKEVLLRNPKTPVDVIIDFAKQNTLPSLKSEATIRLKQTNNLELTKYLATLSQKKKKEILKLLK